MSESDLQAKCIDLIEENGGYVINVVVAGKSGVADLIACIPDREGLGRFCSFEVKVGKNVLQERQVAHHNKVLKAGGLSFKIKSLEDMLLAFQHIYNRAVQANYLKLPDFSL